MVTGTLVSSLFPGHRTNHAITAVNFHQVKPDLLLAAGADGVVSLYDTLSQYPVASLAGQ